MHGQQNIKINIKAILDVPCSLHDSDVPNYYKDQQRQFGLLNVTLLNSNHRHVSTNHDATWVAETWGW